MFRKACENQKFHAFDYNSEKNRIFALSKTNIMNYPLISEYIEAIKLAEENFAQLKHLRPVIGDDGAHIMTSGNFAVVFKMEDPQSGRFYAIKCFTNIA